LVLAAALLVFANAAPTFTGPDLSRAGPQQRAAALMSAGDPLRARAWLEADLARDGHTHDATDRWSDLAVVCRALGDAACADRALLRAIELEPRNVQAAMRLGALRMERGDPRGAADAFARGAQALPMYPPAWRGLADALRAAGDVPGAARAEETLARLMARIARAP